MIGRSEMYLANNDRTFKAASRLLVAPLLPACTINCDASQK